VHIPASLGLKTVGKDTLIQFELPAQEPTTPAKATFSGTPVKFQRQASSVSMTPVKGPQSSSKNVSLRELPVDESDQIDVAMRDRKQAGSTDTVINAADAKKKNLKLPKPLNLALEKPKETLVTLLTDEMIAASEEE